MIMHDSRHQKCADGLACNAVLFGAVLISLAAMRAADLYPARRVERKRRQIRRAGNGQDRQLDPDHQEGYAPLPTPSPS
jgi:hypothetical protein